MALSAQLQDIFDAIMKAHPDGLTLNELSEELINKPVTHADVDELIAALEDAGIDLDGPEPAARPDELIRVLTAARALTEQTGKRPSPEDIARHTSLTPSAVRRALRLGRSAGS